MKFTLLIILPLMYMYICNKGTYRTEAHKIDMPMTNSKVNIKVNAQTFTATLLDNQSVAAFKKMLPLTIKMNELNGNEKYADLPNSIPTNTYKPETIKNGDLMLYGSTTLVLFYKSFSTPYAYTKLGSIDDIKGLTAALGTGDITVSFTLE